MSTEKVNSVWGCIKYGILRLTGCYTWANWNRFRGRCLKYIQRKATMIKNLGLETKFSEEKMKLNIQYLILSKEN